ncbi:formate dehydrogenase [Massilia sp. LjRoot122]|uniref:formate dehydrogenase n=1 Tax=Massilia sp. LjRoot122 TaxID=3342257 RepID=UPI003ECD4670
MEQHPQVQEERQDGKPAAGPDPARRSFLKAAPLGALAVVAGSAGATEAPPAAPVAAPQVKRGYHETEHIRRYYETAAYW